MDQQDLDQDDKPLDPATERVQRKLVRFMAVNLGFLFLALMAVVLALVYRYTRAPEVNAPVGVETAAVPGGDGRIQTVPLPDGARVTGSTLSDNRVALDTLAPDGTRTLVIYDFTTQQVVGRLALPPM